MDTELPMHLFSALCTENNLDSRRPNVDGFVRAIIQRAVKRGTISARAVNEGCITFLDFDGTETAVEFRGAKQVFRMICARMGTFACEHGGSNFSIYEGDHLAVLDEIANMPTRIRISYVNSTAQQQFKVQRLDDGSTC